MWPIRKFSQALASSPCPHPVARPYTPPDHHEGTDPFSDQGYFSNPSNSPPTTLVQNALFSCLGHFENLIQASQPSEEQMEQILSAFEDMASVLSQPESQSRKSDDHLFSELDVIPVAATSTSSSITSSPPRWYGDSSSYYESQDPTTLPSEAYVAEVQNYIVGVRDATQGLKARLDEVKELNWIQNEIITNLRQQLRAVQETARNNVRRNLTRRKVTTIRKQERTGFWDAIGEALDQFGDGLYEL